MVEMLSRNTMIEGDSQSSQYTTTTDSTIPGPGALGGKAIKALGKLTIRGIDRVIINARLRSITSKFPHSNEQALGIKGIREMYNVILELCRSGMYNDELRAKALQLLVVQIKQGQVQLLVEALARWHLIELELLLPEIVDIIIPYRRQPWGRNRLAPEIRDHVLCDLTIVRHPSKTQLRLQKVIDEAKDQDQALRTAYSQYFDPVLSFLSQVAAINTNTCKTVLQAGFLDLLLLVQKGKLDQPKLVTPAVEEKILNVVLNEILNGRINHVIEALSKWNIGDLKSLVMQLQANTPISRVLLRHIGQPSPLEQNITFLFRIVELGKPHLHIVLDAGFLDMIPTAHENKLRINDNRLISIIFEVLKSNSGLKDHRPKALDILIRYIIERKTTHILSMLSRWGHKDREDVIVAVFQRAGPVGFGTEGPFGPRKQVFHSRDGLYHFDQDKVISVMIFAGEVASLSDGAFHAVVNAGMLDALLVIQSHDLSVHRLDEPYNIILGVLRYAIRFTMFIIAYTFAQANSRLGVFGNKIRKKAIDLLVFQVCRGEARYMLKIMSKWKLDELNRLIWEISAQFPPLSNRRALEDLFSRPPETQSLSTLYLQRLLSFLSGIAQISEAASQVVFQTGFMDLLLALQKDKSGQNDFEELDDLILSILQKPQLYEDKTKKKAMAYISLQTEKEATHMYKVIGKRSISELELIIAGMLEHFNLGGRLALNSSALRDPAIDPKHLASLNACVMIFSKVILKHRFAFQALINAGILDLLLAIQSRQCSIDGIKHIYDIILTSVYMESVSDKALKIISYQVMNQSTCLLETLQQYADQEFQIIAPVVLQGLKNALSVHEGHITPCPGPNKKSLTNCIVFLHRLSTINTATFNHLLNAGLVDLFLKIDRVGIPVAALNDLYSMLLEYARPNAYDPDITARVLDYVKIRVETDRSHFFMRALERLDPPIQNNIIKDLVYRSRALWSGCPPSSLGKKKLGDMWISFVHSISAICRLSSSACQIVLEQDILDALYFISENVEQMPVTNQVGVDKVVVRRVIDTFLLDVIAYPEHRDTVFHHPVYPPLPEPKRPEAKTVCTIPSVEWVSQIDIVLMFTTIKTSQQFQYLYFTLLPCATSDASTAEVRQ
ncbi:hypothetical protein JR316_0004236 [Psilocybe cubensis]|uniref:Uncharacterized protein n=2 Tax=Psilocybe cubensis TaxID=181762 RepID=A0A8H8CKT0_PSICU|nr:hypothetical protein JR316_0004236 [Psilocybe cubensis]KAH9482141.1 hypothetical protein JR316_0004236 [Psilocybe cubensis]